MMKAILLAAGTGKRLRPYTEVRPKCLVEIGGRTLLHRHLDILSSLDGIDGLTLVVGYRHDMIREAVAAWVAETGSTFAVDFRLNEDFTRGSILSLYEAREVLIGHDTIAMDADVLYPPAVMQRLIASRHPNCFLIDDSSTETGEEMMVCIRGERAMHIARSRDPSTHTGWDAKGEGVGFFRLAREDARALVATMAALIEAGEGDAEYEVALALFMDEHICGYESIGDLPWTEIDFEEDIDKAERVVLPAIRDLLA
jgi:choline kinase